MAYPASVDTFVPHVDNVDNVDAADVNELQAAITATQTELGTDVAGTAATLKARLANSISAAGLLNFLDSTVLTISGGAITVTQNYHRVDTEAAATSDNLDTISGGVAGMLLILRTTSSVRDVVIRHGVDNILCTGATNIVLESLQDLAIAIYDGTEAKWLVFKGTSANAITGSGVTGQLAVFDGFETIEAASRLEYDDLAASLTIDGMLATVYDADGADVAHVVLSLAAESTSETAAGFGVAIDMRTATALSATAPDARIVAQQKTAGVSHVSEVVHSVASSVAEYEALRVVADSTGIIINEAGADRDVRIEGDTATNLLLIDASADSVNIGTTTAGAIAKFSATSGIIINDDGAAAIDVRAEGDTDANLLFVDASADKVGIGMNNPAQKLDVTGNIKASGYLLQQGIYGGIFVAAASAAQTIPTGATYTKLTAFATNGAAANVTADAANDKITLTIAGKYRVEGSISLTSNINNVTWKACAALGGTEQTNIHWECKVGTGADLINASFTGIITVAGVPVDLDARISHDQGGNVDVTVTYANLNVNYLGS